MKAAVVKGPGVTPIYTDFPDPPAPGGASENLVVAVSASALSQLARGRAAGSHYSSSGSYPFIAGVDGVGRDAQGRRVYFVLPEAPFGSFAEQVLVSADHCIPVPDELDDISAAALANPGMSAWTALVERAHFQAGETVLINGATGTAGRTAVQLARHLGAKKILVSGRNAAELEQLRSLGADLIFPFQLGSGHPSGAKGFERSLSAEFPSGLDVVLDYLWGESARAVIAAIARSSSEAHPVRFIQIGSAGGEENIELPAAALRSSAIQLMGSGLKSVALPTLLASVQQTFQAAIPAGLQIEARAVPLAEIESVWQQAGGRPRVVFTLP